MTINVECDAGGRHELVLRFGWGGAVYECENCDFILNPINALDLLNAAMQLTADEAEVRASKFEIGGIFSVDKRLRGYARTWRGADDQ